MRVQHTKAGRDRGNAATGLGGERHRRWWPRGTGGRVSALAAMLWFGAPTPRAEAWNPLGAAADKARVAALGFIESATTPALHNVEDVGHRLIADADRALATNLERAGGLISQATVAVDGSIAQVDRSLAARILQIQTSTEQVIDGGFDRVDLLLGRLETDAQQLLARAERAGLHLIQQIDQVAAGNLARFDQLLAGRTRDLQLLVSSSIQQADDAARERLAQLDEMAGRRIGNLDVIATKQSLNLEGALVRIAALIGLVGLIVFVSWRLFREIADAHALPGLHGAPRLRAIGRRSATRLLPQLALAGAGALLLSFLSSYLPRDAERRACAQVARHVAAFEAAVRAFDVLEARYHESQLAILAPDAVTANRGRMKQVELLHALFTRPGQLHTPQGLANLVARVGEVEAALGAADPDLMIAKAYILWQVAGTRDDEYQAAVLCAAALRHPGHPLLAPLARNYLAIFLGDPYTARDGSSPADALARGAARPRDPGETAQFDRVIELDGLIRDLDRASTAAYLDMISAHADLRVALASPSRGGESSIKRGRTPSPPAKPAGPLPPDSLRSSTARAARAARTAAANRLVDAWAAFDRALVASTLAGDAMVLSVFTLDDAVLTRARYWAAVPSANGLAPALTDPATSRALAPALRARIAPLRVAWEKRYAAMLGPSARDLVAYQEAQRFAAFEQRARAFETAYVALVVATRTRATAATLRDLAVTAATCASAMGLHRDTDTGRIREATRILTLVGGRGGPVASDALTTIENNYQLRRLRFL